ncbi:hypothetical protein GCM10007169_11790 [Shewanella fodinae]|nr:hypothetical protein GCM10007169_11790 [Shewanella fodinae]
MLVFGARNTPLTARCFNFLADSSSRGCLSPLAYLLQTLVADAVSYGCFVSDTFDSFVEMT